MTTAFLASLILTQATGTQLLTNSDFQPRADGWDVPAQAKRISTPQGPGISVTVDSPSGNPWDIQLRQRVNRKIAKDESFSLRFFARSPEGGKTTAMVQEIEGRWQTLGTRETTLTPEWREYTLVATADRDYPAQGVQVAFHLNVTKGTVELANIRMTEFAVNRPTKDKPGLLLAQIPAARAWTSRASTVSDGTPGIRFTASPAPSANPWDSVVQTPIVGEILPGDVVVFRARMRSKARSRIAAIVEQASAPHTKIMTEVVVLTPEWRDYSFAAPSSIALAAGEGQVTFFAGYGPTDVEVSSLRVENVGRTRMSELGIKTDPYGGQANPNTWLAPAQARIEKFRKSDLNITVLDSAGRPVPNAEIKVEQQSHHFRFGTAVTQALINGTDSNSSRYRQILSRLFNTAVFENDMKWGQPGNATPEGRIQTERAMKWLETNRFRVRGHNLVWGSDQYLPGNVKGLNDDQLRAPVRERVRTMTALFKGRLYAWDVVNEAVTENSLWNRLGWSEFREAYRLTKEVDPTTKTVYNDFNVTEESQAGPRHREQFLKLVREQLAAGAKIDILGLQGHVNTPLTPTGRVIELLDETAKIGLPIEITEYDVTLFDDEQHAAHNREFLTACFSQPSVEAIILWGFWAGAHWRGENASLYRMDWTPRPAAKVWEDLIYKEWWTNATVKAGRDGKTSLRAFHGDQKLSVRIGSTTFEEVVKVLPGQAASVTLRAR